MAFLIPVVLSTQGQLVIGFSNTIALTWLRSKWKRDADHTRFGYIASHKPKSLWDEAIQQLGREYSHFSDNYTVLGSLWADIYKQVKVALDSVPDRSGFKLAIESAVEVPPSSFIGYVRELERRVVSILGDPNRMAEWSVNAGARRALVECARQIKKLDFVESNWYLPGVGIQDAVSSANLLYAPLQFDLLQAVTYTSQVGIDIYRELSGESKVVTALPSSLVSSPGTTPLQLVSGFFQMVRSFDTEASGPVLATLNPQLLHRWQIGLNWMSENQLKQQLMDSDQAKSIVVDGHAGLHPKIVEKLYRINPRYAEDQADLKRCLNCLSYLSELPQDMRTFTTLPLTLFWNQMRVIAQDTPGLESVVDMLHRPNSTVIQQTMEEVVAPVLKEDLTEVVRQLEQQSDPSVRIEIKGTDWSPPEKDWEDWKDQIRLTFKVFRHLSHDLFDMMCQKMWEWTMDVQAYIMSLEGMATIISVSIPVVGLIVTNPLSALAIGSTAAPLSLWVLYKVSVLIAKITVFHFRWIPLRIRRTKGGMAVLASFTRDLSHAMQSVYTKFSPENLMLESWWTSEKEEAECKPLTGLKAQLIASTTQEMYAVINNKPLFSEQRVKLTLILERAMSAWTNSSKAPTLDFGPLLEEVRGVESLSEAATNYRGVPFSFFPSIDTSYIGQRYSEEKGSGVFLLLLSAAASWH